jgi:hypothetical protein
MGKVAKTGKHLSTSMKTIDTRGAQVRAAITRLPKIIVSQEGIIEGAKEPTRTLGLQPNAALAAQNVNELAWYKAQLAERKKEMVDLTGLDKLAQLTYGQLTGLSREKAELDKKKPKLPDHDAQLKDMEKRAAAPLAVAQKLIERIGQIAVE